MPVMKLAVGLLDSAGGNPTGVTAAVGDKAEITDTATVGPIRWAKIKLGTADPKPEGWVQRGTIDETADALGVTDQMLEQCVEESDKYGVNAYYLAAVATLRTGLLPADATRKGPFRLTDAEWMANLPLGAKYQTSFVATEIDDWLAQFSLFAIMAREMQLRTSPLLKAEPSMVQLLLAQMVGSKAAVAINAVATDAAAPIIAAISAGDAASEGLDLGNIAGRDKDLLAGATNADLLVAIETKLVPAFETVKPTVRKQVDKILQTMVMTVGAPKPRIAFKFPSTHIDDNPKKVMAEKVTQKFADAGYGADQQVAALANAIGESALDPGAKGDGGNSWGLFQLNRKSGVGVGYEIPELTNPDRNIEIMLAEIAKKHQKKAQAAFIAANTFDEAIRVFVHEFERPADKDGDTQERIGFAQTFV